MTVNLTEYNLFILIWILKAIHKNFLTNFRPFRVEKASSQWFSLMDTDNDGSISPWEFDGSSGLSQEVVNWIEMKKHGSI